MELSFGELLRLRRNRLNISQVRAAELQRVNPATIIDIEKERIDLSPAGFAVMTERYDEYERTLQPNELNAKK